jgi:hypothetical protein
MGKLSLTLTKVPTDSSLIRDRNARVRFSVRIRQDVRLTPATRLVANALLFACVDSRTGRCQPYRARIAHEAGVSERTVTRAVQSLRDAEYLDVTPTWGKRHRTDGRRWYRPRGANVLEWRIPIDFSVRDSVSLDPSPSFKNQPMMMDEGLSKAMTRLANSMADRNEADRLRAMTQQSA